MRGGNPLFYECLFSRTEIVRAFAHPIPVCSQEGAGSASSKHPAEESLLARC